MEDNREGKIFFSVAARGGDIMEHNWEVESGGARVTAEAGCKKRSDRRGKCL